MLEDFSHGNGVIGEAMVDSLLEGQESCNCNKGAA